MRSRIPLAYAAFLIIALMAVIGVAAFSAGSGSDEAATEPTPASSEPVSARVASAVFAVSVTPEAPETVTAATPPPSTVEDEAQPEELTAESLETTETTAEPTTTTAAPTTTTKAPADTTPPALRVTSPENGATVEDRLVTFRGTTERGATVASGPYNAAVDDDGSWTIQLVVSPGANGAAFTATDKAGNTTTVRIVVHYDEPAPPATTTTTEASGGGDTTTTTAAPASKWSPLWPADAGGIRNVETWRPLVEQYWDADKVDCALGLIKIESRGDPRAYNSSTGAEGLFQHLSKYWKGRAAGAGFVDGNGLYATPYNGEANIAAAAYLANYYEDVGKNWWQPWGIMPSYGSCGSGG